MPELDLSCTQRGEDGAGTMQTHLALVRDVPGKYFQITNSSHMCGAGAAEMMRLECAEWVVQSAEEQTVIPLYRDGIGFRGLVAQSASKSSTDAKHCTSTYINVHRDVRWTC